MSIKSSKAKVLPSSNWMNLQKTLQSNKLSNSRKRRKLDQDKTISSTLSNTSGRSQSPSSSSIHLTSESSKTRDGTLNTTKNSESRVALQQMVLGHLEYTENQKLPGKYLSLDCEMVGVGIEGEESSLARVSLVNFYGVVIMDEIVRQKERVVDYRTQWSGIRESDMVHAKPFEEIQKRVSDLLKDKILVGHAVHNDLKALLLSHPRMKTRDTQIYSHKFSLTKSRRVALRNLVKQELDLTIQGGEHSSITDARATMAVYRIHKKEWEKGSRPPPVPKVATASSSAPATSSTKSRKRTAVEAEFASDSESESQSDTVEPSTNNTNNIPKLKSTSTPQPTVATKKGKTKDSSTIFPGGGRKGVSSGLSTVIKKVTPGSKMSHSTLRGNPKSAGGAGKSEWWKQLPGGVSIGGGAKASITIGVKR
ncbi:hypothetical protein M413DRAFT_449924 [Hebeloma cylindrosporum]|uniref:RNA exonuclease 4 n=1 Tax=Hebeloma cylindrosporum TaxID=76867 RepID=A0A0C2XAN5_HEBCY|nr:hypothetical protein M413DRAFT_449924 [Hebeloma cylindrosporum h7]